MDAGDRRFRTRILHVLPEDGIGGAEVAAHSAAVDPGSAVRIVFLSGELSAAARGVEVCAGHHPLRLKAALFALRVALRDRPHVVVVSLWKSIFAFLVLRIFCRDMQLVTLLHTDRTVHLADRIAHSIMLRLSDAIWADSVTSLDTRCPDGTSRKRTRAISFRVRRIAGSPRTEPAASFIFWGRLAPEKNLEEAVELFARVAQHDVTATFTIIGRDDGSRASVEERARELGVADRVMFKGQLPFEDIIRLAASARFYLQASRFEGMAMSVVEAMQLGLVPVVTPVGEITRYCRHFENALIFRRLDEAESGLRTLLDDPKAYARMSRAAVDTWRDVPLYKDDIVAAAEELVERTLSARQ